MQISEWADNHLVPGWRKAHKFISVRAAMLQAALLSAWTQVPDDLRQSLPHWLFPALAGFVLIVGTAGVMVNQKSLVTPPEAPHV